MDDYKNNKKLIININYKFANNSINKYKLII